MLQYQTFSQTKYILILIWSKSSLFCLHTTWRNPFVVPLQVRWRDTGRWSWQWQAGGSQIKKRNNYSNHPGTRGRGNEKTDQRRKTSFFLQVLKATGSPQSALYFRVQNLFTPAVLQRLRGRVKLGNGDTAVHVLINPSQLSRYTLVLFARTSVGLKMCICVRTRCLITCRFSLKKGHWKEDKKVRLGSALQACLQNKRFAFFLQWQWQAMSSTDCRPCRREPVRRKSTPFAPSLYHGGFDMDRPCQ